MQYHAWADSWFDFSFQYDSITYLGAFYKIKPNDPHFVLCQSTLLTINQTTAKTSKFFSNAQCGEHEWHVFYG